MHLAVHVDEGREAIRAPTMMKKEPMLLLLETMRSRPRQTCRPVVARRDALIARPPPHAFVP